MDVSPFHKSDDVLSIVPFPMQPESDAPAVQRSWARWTLWQYSDGDLGSAPQRIGGQPAFDRSVFCADVSQLMGFWGRIAVDW